MNNISVFEFESKELEVVIIGGNPWFNASQFAKALGYSNPSEAIQDNVSAKYSQQLDLKRRGKKPVFINEPGLYQLIMISNAKTLEILYVGKADNLLLRISDKPRYRNLSWLTKEGAENLFVKWIICDNISDQESLSIYQLKPKYNKQRPILPLRIAEII